MFRNHGVWRSLVARAAGGREVAGSNPVAPIKEPVFTGSFSFRFIYSIDLSRNISISFGMLSFVPSSYSISTLERMR